MTIFRVQHQKNYTCVNNFICKDNRISWKSKGIWLYAFSRPDDWEFNITDLINQSTDGEKSVKAGLRELEEFGYLNRVQIRDESNRFSNAEWQFFETPQEKSEEIKINFPQCPFGPAEIRPAQKDGLLNTEVNQVLKTTTGQEPVVVFYKCLEKEKMSDSDKHSLMKFPEDRVNLAVEFSHLVPFTTSLVQQLIWHCKKEEPPVPAKKSSDFWDAFKNKFKHGEQYNGATCWFLENSVAFERGMNHQSVLISARDAKEKLLKILNSFGVEWEHLKA